MIQTPRPAWLMFVLLLFRETARKKSDERHGHCFSLSLYRYSNVGKTDPELKHWQELVPLVRYVKSRYNKKRERIWAPRVT